MDPLPQRPKWGIKNPHANSMPVDAENQGYYKIELCLTNKETQKDILTILVEVGGLIKEGTAPPMKPIRELEKALKDLRR